jgi:hypothetical protein
VYFAVLKARQNREWRYWLVLVCLLSFVLFVGLQAVHMHLLHPNDDLAGGTCLVCASAHTSATITIQLTQILLIAVASVAIVRAWSAPSYEAVLPLFIRPPPSL